MNTTGVSPYPFDTAFYEALSVKRSGFRMVSEHIVPARSGYGWRVNAGQAFRIVMVEGGQVVDLCIFSAEDPHEHYSAGAQFYTEGARVTRHTRLWGTPPRSRPLATITGDTVRSKPEAGGRGLREAAKQHHKCYGAHCNPHHWLLFAGIHPPTCYDNLRDACAQLGLSQYYIHDNLNLFGRFAMDPESGMHNAEPNQAERGDYLEFFAETDLLLAVSACPYGYAARPPDQWKDAEIPARPIGIQVFDTGVTPLGWPYSSTPTA
jgi:uncharacterized protein YcgI (DUF1989 family)